MALHRLPYEGVRFDASQGFAEVNWTLMAEAKRMGVGVQSVGRVVTFGDALAQTQTVQAGYEGESTQLTDPRLFSLQDMVRMKEEE